MRFAPLVVLSLAGCSLYFGPDTPSPGAPSGDQPSPEPTSGAGGAGGAGDGGSASGAGSGDTQNPGGLPARCGSPEVHVIGIYETSSAHDTNNHPVGDARVTIERLGDHILVLSAYEPTSWHISLATGATVRAVQLFGYYTQTVDLTNVRVTQGTACGYSYPYNGGGCDTNALLATVEAQTGAHVTTFHGCYQASDWTLHVNGTASSNCNTAAGYQQFELLGKCRR